MPTDPPNGQGYVYFLVVKEHNKRHLKIGHTSDPNIERRIQNLKNGNAATTNKLEIELVVVVSGTSDSERRVHRHFVNQLIPNTKECFRNNGEMAAYLRWLISFPKSGTNADAASLVACEFKEWMPTSSRCENPNQPYLFDRNERDIWDFESNDQSEDDYWTPVPILETVRSFYGSIDLDPASCSSANQFVMAERIYTPEDNGLEKHWYGKVFTNPPFSIMQSFCQHAISEWKSGHIEQLLVWVGLRHLSAKQTYKLLELSTRFLIVSGRLKHGGFGTKQPDQGNALIYLGEQGEKFFSSFEGFGIISMPVS